MQVFRDLDKAREYYSQALESYPEHDTVGRAQCLAQLGAVALQRLKEELGGAQRDDVMHDFFYEAVEYYTAVLRATPVDDLVELAQVHNQLGVAYQYAVDGAEQAYEHFRQAVHYNDLAQETYEAVVTRMNAVQVLDRLERFEEALIFAREAIATIESTGMNFEHSDHLRTLAADIERRIARSGG